MYARPYWERWLRRRMSRRRALQGSAVTLTALAVSAPGCSSPSPTPPNPAPRTRRSERTHLPSVPVANRAFSEWSRYARIANASFGEDPLLDEMEATVRQLKAQHVSVVEVDTHLSDWLDDDEFEMAMAVAAQLNRVVQREGMSVVWYYPALEVVSVGGQFGPSMFKTHPDWVQVALNGYPNVFYGGVVFWVDPGDESAWMSPNGPWRQVYIERVKKLVRTGADGLWPDVPLYFDVAHSWPDISHWARAAFRAEMGLSLPSREDWEDPTWRRWIAWRHNTLNQFLIDVTAAARSVNPEFELFIETVPCDFYDATSMGLDGAYLRTVEGATHAWEVDTTSDSNSMHHANHDDWISLISMYRYCRAASGLHKPAWVFSKGWRETDARQVMAEVLAAGCNPYEVQVPGKTIGVSPEMRTHMYRWVAANTREIFDARLVAEIALFHSSPSRDYVDPNDGTSKFCTTDWPPGVAEWWSDKRSDSCYVKQWIGEYRGMLKILVHAHLPFAVVTSPTFTADDLAGIKVLLLPDVEALFDRDADLFRGFVRDGGTIIITGPNPTGMNEYGDSRSEYALADMLGISKRSRLPDSRHTTYGAGQVFYISDLVGLEYLNDDDPSDAERLLGPILQVVKPWVTTDAGPSVHLEAKELDGDAVLHFTNFTGVAGDLKVVPTTFTVRVTIPEGREVRSVQVTSPDNPTPERTELPSRLEDGKVVFTLTVAQYSLVVVQWS